MHDYLIIIDKINQKFEQFKLLVLQETEMVKELENFHLTPQQEIIMFYIIRNEPVIANDIANHFNISKSAVSQVISKLEEMKMIFRQVNSINRRETLIYIGDKGQEFHQLLKKIDEMLVEKYYSKVSLTELKNVLDTLNKIVGTK
ncbi:MarR family winged helix-turn-helix transcriptional regulator [Bacillus badius]|uniref:Transcriptional regulator, MarR family n=1 Tax=Bacillus badius TaxID=1455 RepID=A0ABR5AQG5_BACBA|nr:MarR family transcriptional regulator [Bacillus badius]KIL74147.1 Transcriptional regulator, MarR family [Bacillus badius]KIL74773.1 Transcriptional regulator, MarR family [Bacillus badius]KZR57486.1 MarR family transcriptional regulator [Bacillus badius]MED4718370.1 MarR family transcriptional regulator [Bacillus badius]